MKKIIIIFIAFMLINSLSYSQAYKAGIGIRGGINSGISTKFFVYKSPKMYGAIEAIIGTHYLYKGYNLFAFWENNHEIHMRSMRYAHLYFFYGIGGHGGAYENNNKQEMDAGPDAIIGMEYIFADFPVSIGLDFKPYFNLVPEQKFFPDGAVSIRYVFK